MSKKVWLIWFWYLLLIGLLNGYLAFFEVNNNQRTFNTVAFWSCVVAVAVHFILNKRLIK